MLKILTPSLLELLSQSGYTCFLSRTTAICGPDADLCITLVPIKYTPDLETLPDIYDTYFEIDEEPVQMALGVDETLILVDLRAVRQSYLQQIYDTA